ncbi:hypothetical protein CTRI78_v010195 [Colletotrichum trifolii]|uniref:Uncharacterized protein n=1 Tax=Colletotrichum trifolii TaxID=5466 RepID=A0A4R8QTE7_COLTR|nr:hypothetical protein CTRI78_v010195 [Colletotrichum trifolii]
MKFLTSVVATLALSLPSLTQPLEERDVQTVHLTFHGGPASYQLTVPADGRIYPTNNGIAVNIIDAPDYNAISQCTFYTAGEKALVSGINPQGVQQVIVGPPQPVTGVSCSGICVPTAAGPLIVFIPGGVIAFQFALDFPDAVEHIIAHEAPTVLLLLPDAGEVFGFLYRLQEVYETEGVAAAAAGGFRKALLGYDDAGVPATVPPEAANPENFLGQRVSRPDVLRADRDAFFARAVEEQAKILGCLKFDVPDHHEGFQVELDAFLPYFIDSVEEESDRGEVRSRTSVIK